MQSLACPRRLNRLPRATFLGIEVPVADSGWARLLGLALLDRERAGPGLWIPSCRSVHTFGMRFGLDLIFLDRYGRVVRHVGDVQPGRLVSCADAFGALELPARPVAA